MMRAVNQMASGRLQEVGPGATGGANLASPGRAPNLQRIQPVATISVRAGREKRLVTVHGRLEARDLRRLERACGPALEYREMPLELRLVDRGGMDETARVFLAELVKRGAVVS